MKTKNFVILGLVIGLLVGGRYASAETESVVKYEGEKIYSTSKEVTIFNRTHGQMYIFWEGKMISLEGKSKTPSPVEPEKFFVFKTNLAKKIRLSVQIYDSTVLMISSDREFFFNCNFWTEANWVFFEEEDGKIRNDYNYIKLTEKREEEEK